LTKIKTFHKRYNLPSPAKPWPAVTRKHIELEGHSNPETTREVL